MEKTNKLEVQRGKTQTIIPMQERICPSGYVFKLTSGEVVVSGVMSGIIDHPADQYSIPMPLGQTSRALSWRRSYDGGETWHETPAWPTYSAYQLPDGKIIQLSNRWWQEVDNQGTYSLRLFSSINDGYTFKEEQILLLDVPKLAISENQPYSDKERWSNVIHPMVELYDGSLLTAAQSRFKSDTKTRSIILQSHNQGKIWKYLSTVAFDLTKNGMRSEGFDEPSLLVLPNGNILCFMRSGSSPRPGGGLYMSRSRDNGQTWSHADPIADRGVFPTACLMTNGIIAVVYGRPGDWLTFSLDQGETWVNHVLFNQGPGAYDCTSYNWVAEIAPNKLLVIYTIADPNNCMLSKVMGTYFTVKPRAIKK